jgi:DNA-binding transcriptional LysR family regulator
MNLHHLELFYYVARYQGIAEALRHMPYGLQQPALSAQLIQLEKDLGSKLFHRRPFALTVSGSRLYQHLEPFFGRLDLVETAIRDNAANPVLRLGGPYLSLRDHLPRVIARTKVDIPDLQLIIRECSPIQAMARLLTDEIDIAISIPIEKSPAKLQSLPLVSLPLALLVPKKSPLKSAEQLLDPATLRQHPHIGFPARETVTTLFQKGLQARGLEWPVAVEVQTFGLIQDYVALGFGVGVVIPSPGWKFPSTLRLIPLPDFPKLEVHAFWSHDLPDQAQAFLNHLQAYVKEL